MEIENEKMVKKGRDKRIDVLSEMDMIKILINKVKGKIYEKLKKKNMGL